MVFIELKAKAPPFIFFTVLGILRCFMPTAAGNSNNSVILLL
jgi:hypothetical protein